MKLEKKKILRTLLDITIAGVAAFVIFYFIGVFVAMVMEDSSRELRSVVACLEMPIFFALSYGFVYIKRRWDNFEMGGTDASVSFKSQYISFIKEELKYILVIFSILAIINELSYFVMPNKNPLSIVLGPIFMPGNLIKIPIIRSLIPLLLNILLMPISALLWGKRFLKKHKKK